jgi:hypothetical protein
MEIGFVYWLHREVDTDHNTQGYVGVSKNPGGRYLGYLKFAEGSRSGDSSNNRRLISAIRKYDDVVCDMLYMGDRESCLLVEEMLRPEDNIGWNFTKGGGHPPQGEHQNFFKNNIAKNGYEEFLRTSLVGSKLGYKNQPEEAKARARSNGGKASCASKTKEQRSAMTKGKFWWNNGVKNVRAYTCPEGFVKGRISKSTI